jgi:hypothetical protein
MSSKGRVNVTLPLLMGGEGSEVLGLELLDDAEGELGLGGEGGWLASVVTAVTEFLTHEAVSVMSIVWLLSDIFVVLEVTCPREVRPANSSNCCMDVSRFNGVEVGWVIEQVPFNCADAIGLA